MDRDRKENAMRSFYARSVALTLGILCLAGTGWAQDVGAPSLLPIPSYQPSYPVTQTAANDSLWSEAPASPAPVQSQGPLPSPSDEPSVIADDYKSAMSGGWNSCTTCGGSGCDQCAGCGCCRFIYANALAMTRSRSPHPTSRDSDPSVVLDCADVQNGWFGGFEIGGGWCFNGGANALEVVYWGLFPAQQSADFTGDGTLGTLEPAIDFSGLNYNDGFQNQGANNWFEDAERHQITQSSSINSVEVNLVGNYGCGGLFGCGACGCGANRCGCSPWGFGWVGGFRYFNFNENFLFQTDDLDHKFTGDSRELNYAMDLNNNLFGFQVGGGINYCVGPSWSLYSTAKFGVYDNHATMYQRVYGSTGYAVANNNVNAGQDFRIRSTENDLAMLGQMDFGVRWLVGSRWSIQGGYRLVGVSGVALTSQNIATDFANYKECRNINTNGSLLLHGAFLGATYCF
jgi:hypothetical protein